MSKAIITEELLDDIANAIITKGGSSAALTPVEMALAIAQIPSGGNIGGLANMINISDETIVFANTLSKMKNGQTVGGTVTWANAFPNTESLLISTGLTSISGLIIASTEQGLSDPSWLQANRFFILFYDLVSDKLFCVGISTSNVSSKWEQENGVAANTTPINGTLRINGGDIYYTGRYNKNNGYQVVRSGEPYEWLAW